MGNVTAYVSEFQKLSQNLNFNENALIFMFLKGLHPHIREKLAFLEPGHLKFNCPNKVKPKRALAITEIREEKGL